MASFRLRRSSVDRFTLAVLVLFGVAAAWPGQDIAPRTLSSAPTRTTLPTTDAPHLNLRRGVNSICGYIYYGGQAYSITCSYGIPCVQTHLGGATPYVNRYCSSPGALPITTIYPYGYWPVGGCQLGQECCPEDVALCLYNGSKTRQVVCVSYGVLAYQTLSATTALPGTFVSSLVVAPTESAQGGGSGRLHHGTKSSGGKGGGKSHSLSTGGNTSSGGSNTSTLIAEIVGPIGAFFALVGVVIAFIQLKRRKKRDREKDRKQGLQVQGYWPPGPAYNGNPVYRP